MSLPLASDHRMAGSPDPAINQPLTIIAQLASQASRYRLITGSVDTGRGA